MDNDEVHSIVGAHGSRTAGDGINVARAGIEVDTEAIAKLDTSLKAVKGTLVAMQEVMQDLANASAEVANNVNGILGAQGGGGPKAKNGMPLGQNSSPGAPLGIGGGGRGFFNHPGGGAFGGGAGGGLSGQLQHLLGTGRGGVAALIGGGLLGMGVQAMDRRIDDNRAYSLSADRLTMETMLRTGQSQMGVMQDLRRPMTSYRLGAGGVNALHAFENRYGTGSQQAASIENLRALTGYSMGTQDLLSILQTNLDPRVANQQFLMGGGLNALTFGGGVADMGDVMRQRVGMFNLSDPTIQRSARLPGSITRYRMRMSGISEEEQDLLIQMGAAQSNFERKGGKGNFDLTDPEHRKLAGVEDTFAAQTEESERLRTKRDEDMYRRQADNYADLEKSNQKLIKALNSLEETFSGAIGARASTRPWQRLAGRLLTVGGAAALGMGSGGIGTAAMLGAGAFLGGMGGDPSNPDAETGSGGRVGGSSSANDANIVVPFGWNQTPTPLSEVKRKPTFTSLSAIMQQRLLQMMRDNPNVGIGVGQRANTEAEFRRRYQEVPAGQGDRKWNGKEWKLRPGFSAYAPPGGSMHEIGMAADLVGDINWVVAHAGDYGLQHFANVNDEPWHVQPAEYPRGRSAYEDQYGESGATGGGFIGSVADYVGSSPQSEHNVGGADGKVAFLRSDAADFSGFTISEIVASYVMSGVNRGVGKVYSKSGTPGGRSASTFPAPATSFPEGARIAAEAAYAAGFRGDDLIKMVAIAGRESDWSNLMSKNSADTGMWQVNWEETDAPHQMGLTSREQLLDPFLNARVAMKMFQNAQGYFDDPWRPWRASDDSQYLRDRGISWSGYRGWDPNGDPLWNTEGRMAQAVAAVNSLPGHGSGDPNMQSSGPVSMGSNLNINRQFQIDFSPVFHIGEGARPMDIKQAAKEAAMYLREQVELAAQRSE